MNAHREGLKKMKCSVCFRRDSGFSLIEMLVCLLILIPIMGAAVGFFSIGINQHTTEQSAIEMNQDARSGLEIMTMELAQAGSHDSSGVLSTSSSAAIAASASAQNVSVASTTGFTIGDYVTVDNGTSQESVQIASIGSGTIRGVFRTAHAAGTPIRLFALPYMKGVIPPAGLGSNSSATVTTIRFFGDINGDGTLNYVEYAYDSTAAQITRSMTPITAGALNSALPIISKIKANSAQFVLYTDGQGIITSATIKLTVQDTVTTVSKKQETVLSTRVSIPSTTAASALFAQNQTSGGVNKLPPIPTQVTAWANR
jgi:Tfp pilus assembly protein PilW